MTAERKKSTMVSARLPTSLVERTDYVTRNTDSKTVNNRSTAVRAALEAWLPGQEQQLVDLGVLTKKPAKKRGVSENEIHMKCAKWVRDTYPQLLIFHVANELKAHVSYHLKQKRLGKLPGVADFLAFPNGGAKVAIELKDDKGKQDADQTRFQRRWERTGGAYYLVRTLAEFQSIVSALVLFG